jgi:hypothetical protein
MDRETRLSKIKEWKNKKQESVEPKRIASLTPTPASVSTEVKKRKTEKKIDAPTKSESTKTKVSSEIDDIFQTKGKPKPAPKKEAPKKARRDFSGDLDSIFQNKGGSSMIVNFLSPLGKSTEGLSVFTEEELNMNKGGGKFENHLIIRN